MIDSVEKIGKSLVQHGPHNKRIYLMKADAGDLIYLLGYFEELAEENGYSKIFAKIPESHLTPFLSYGYEIEASIPGLFNAVEQGHFVSRYIDDDRKAEKQPELVEEVLKIARSKQAIIAETSEPSCVCRPLFADEMEDAAAVYSEVFASYPFPIHDPEYLRSTMESITYFGVWLEDRLVALASAEVDFDNGNAEMTDFATLPEFRGKGYANLLLARMETDMKDKQIPSLFTIARAYSHGMNITFAKNGYLYSGTLTNNTQISGDLESMNVWYKLLPTELVV
ncbi:MAG: putative beta-lysine N-acetyltransferase [Desulfuromonas sp.]|nr:MAG: putative beta-lysine N-acetyltransferase [Desulfuromonas sp.]